MASHKAIPSNYSVFLRIKPKDVCKIDDNITGFVVDNNSVVVTNTRKGDDQKDEFKFTKVFMPSSSQKEVFDAVVHPQLKDVIQGEDSLIFSYGATNSGKSFTMQGTPSCPGIIPRVLRALFGHVENIDTTNPLQPYRNSSVIHMNDTEKRSILNLKESLVESVTNDGREACNATISSTEPDNVQFEDEILEKISLCDDRVVGVWVSFYEIYNENIHDLLNPAEAITPLNVLKDREDDSFYPEGLIHVPVHSWEEGFNVYRAGKKRLKVSSTLMNRLSSRSHCVFSIKLLIRPKDSSSSYESLNNISFCDLAGNERVVHLAEAVSSVEKKETIKINSSLQALNKYLVILQSNQGKMTTMPSFRDSKLTMVLKKYLSGKGRLGMLANISQDPELRASSLNILKMTAVAISTRFEAPPHRVASTRRRYSVAFLQTPKDTRKDELPAVTPTPEVSELAALKIEAARKDDQIADLMTELALKKTQCEDLEMRLADCGQHENSYVLRMETKNEELTEKVRGLNKKVMNLLCRLHNYEYMCEDLFERLAETHNLSCTEPEVIVHRAIQRYLQARELAEEEIGELDNQNRVLRQQLEGSTLEVATLTGQLMQTQTELEIERDLSESLRVQIMELRKQLETTDGSSCNNVGSDSVSGYEATFEGPYSGRQVNAHQSLRWVSDDESSPAPPRTAATTGRKRKGRKKKEPAAIVARRIPSRRLLSRAAGNDHLPSDLSTEEPSIQELQPSPNAVLRSCRSTRSHK